MIILVCCYSFQVCNYPACFYLHSIGPDEDSFGKDEDAAEYTRYHLYKLFSFLWVVFQHFSCVGSVSFDKNFLPTL